MSSQERVLLSDVLTSEGSVDNGATQHFPCFAPLKTKEHLVCGCPSLWRRHPDLNRGVRVLQTLALPLGYGAKKNSADSMFGAGNEIRTRDIHLGKVALYH